MIDKVKALDSGARNKRVVISYIKKVENFTRDPLLSERKEESLCKYCKYLSDRIGCDVMTEKTCDCCGKKMMFPNSCVDDLCVCCAKRHGHCKHCSQKMD